MRGAGEVTRQEREGVTRGADASDVWRDQTCSLILWLNILLEKIVTFFSRVYATLPLCINLLVGRAVD